MNYYERKARVSFRKDVSASTQSQATQTPDPEAIPEQHKATTTKQTATTTSNATPISRGSGSGSSSSCIAHTSSCSTSTEHAIISDSSCTNIATTNATLLGRYTNWNNDHATLAAQPWCCIGDLMYFCDKYEFQSISASDTKTHSVIVAQVTALLSAGRAPFDACQRFPADMYSPEHLWVCIGRCPNVEYHLKRILSAFRKPLAGMSADKRRAAIQNFHLAVNELRLDISARITEMRLYDRFVFERELHLNWLDTL